MIHKYTEFGDGMDFFSSSGWNPIEEFSFDGLNAVFHYVKDKEIPVERYNRPRRVQDVEAPRCPKFVSLRPRIFRRQLAPPSSGKKKAMNAS
jgi:hypothetical protein